MPDPATLDADADDDVPLSVVKEKANVERRESVRKGSAGQSAAPRQIPAPPQVDLIGGEIASVPPPRASTAGPAAMHVPPKSSPAPPKTTSTKDSLLGLDFLGTEPAAPPRPASTTGTPSTGGQSRPDLKQSILSLYATAPRPQPQAPPQQASHGATGSFSGLSSPPGMSQTQNSFGGLNDAFSGLSFASSPSPKPAQVDAFSSLGSFTSSRPTAQTNNSTSAFSGLSGGSFFDSKPAAPAHQQKQSIGALSGWGSVSTPASPPKPVATTAPAALGDLFDFSSPAPPQTAPAPKPVMSSPPIASTSVFNLSQPKPAPAPAPTATPSISKPLSSFGGSNLSGADVWGSSAWATVEAPKPEPPKPAVAPAPTNDFGWGSFASQPIVPSSSGGFAPAPIVSPDEEFGAWRGTTAPAASTNNTAKPASGLGGDDLFSNVWQ